MKYFLVKPISYGEDVYVIGWSVDGEILEDTRRKMKDGNNFSVISEDELYKMVTEYV